MSHQEKQASQSGSLADRRTAEYVLERIVLAYFSGLLFLGDIDDV